MIISPRLEISEDRQSFRWGRDPEIIFDGVAAFSALLLLIRSGSSTPTTMGTASPVIRTESVSET